MKLTNIQLPYVDPEEEVLYKSLNLRDLNDLGLIKMALKKRFPITDKDKVVLVESIRKALNIEASLMAPDPKKIAALGKLLIEMETSNQSDEHLDIKNSRIDNGQGTEEVIITINPGNIKVNGE